MPTTAIDGEREQLRIAAKPEHCRRIKYLAQAFGIASIGIGEKLAAGFGKCLELLICCRARMAIGDKLHALDRKFQSFEISKTDVR